MPTRVKSHMMTTRSGKRVRVKSFIRRGPEHSAKWKRCIDAVEKSNRRRGTKYSPYAVCTASIGRGSYRPLTQPRTGRRYR